MKPVMIFFPYKSISAYAVIVAFSALLYANLNYKSWVHREVIDWDVTSYYGYLPAAFIHKDLKLDFLRKDEMRYKTLHQFWPETADNGGKVIKTTMGLSILYAPFFALAHLIATTQGYGTDGFSAPYQVCIHFSALFYLFFALVFLRKLLLLLFSETATSLTIVAVVLGSNLFYYATFEPAMSHAYNFFLITVFLYYSFKWHQQQSWQNTLAIGLIGGLIVLIRPVNVLIFIVPIVLHVSSYKEFIAKLHFFWSKRLAVLSIVLCIGLILLPQLIYWKYVTGHFFFNSYVGERFFFNHPQLINGLLSYRKGWLVYTPIMFFALSGLYFLFQTRKDLFWATLIFTLVNCYVLFSWWSWWYGGGFGMRPMIDTYGLFAIPMAAFFQYCFDAQKSTYRYFLVPAICFFIWLNIFQTKQYIDHKIHYDAMTKEAYWINFLKMNDIDWETYDSKLRSPDYDKARRGEDEY